VITTPTITTTGGGGSALKNLDSYSGSIQQQQQVQQSQIMRPVPINKN
jgi:hypothetical protein